MVAYLSGIPNPEGWMSTICAIFMFGGSVLLTLGIMGVYLGNAVDIQKNRPIYVIQESINCNEENS